MRLFLSHPPQKDIMPDTATTSDDFLGGRLNLLQPVNGFRAGIDTVLLAAAVNPTASTILELGTGAGIAACCVLADLPETRMDLVEQNETMLELARHNLRNNGFADRARLIHLDLTVKGSQRSAAGMGRDHYDSVIANPPFFPLGAAVPAPNGPRATARHMPPGDLEKWIRTATASVRPGGEVIFIHTTQSLPALLKEFSGRFGAITILPLVSRPGEAANRLLIRGIKGSRAPLCLLSALVLHEKQSGAFQELPRAIFAGKARLNW